MLLFTKHNLIKIQLHKDDENLKCGCYIISKNCYKIHTFKNYEQRLEAVGLLKGKKKLSGKIYNFTGQ